ncbi:MAG: hypothetical protein ACJ76N_30295, partial [Thermoanaerobaculia bacterium]
RTVVSVVSEDLAGHLELTRRILEVGSDFEPRLVLKGVAAPAVRLLADEDQVPGLIARLHGELLPGGPDEVVE